MHPYAPSTPTFPGTKTSRFRWRRVFLFFAIPIGILWLVVFGLRLAWTIRESQGRSQMERELEGLVQAGLPIDNESIDARYRQATSSTHTEEWLAVHEELQSGTFTADSQGVPTLDPKIESEPFEEDFKLYGEWPAAEISSRLVNKYQALIERICILSEANEPVYFPIEFRSWETLLPNTQSMRDVSRVVLLDARVALRNKEVDRLFRDLMALLRTSRVIEEEPFIVSHLVSVAMRRLALGVVRHAIESNLLSDEQWDEIATLLQERTEIGSRWARTLQGEQGISLPCFRDPKKSMKMKKPISIPARGHDAVVYIGIMRRAMEIPTEDLQYFRKEFLAVESDFLKSTRGGILASADRILTNVLFPPIAAFGDILIDEVTMHRQAIVAIELRRYERRYGEMPMSLMDLPAEVHSLRPFGSKPFGYQKNAAPAVLWSFRIKQCQETPDEIPSTDQLTNVAEENREIVWRFPSK